MSLILHFQNISSGGRGWSGQLGYVVLEGKQNRTQATVETEAGGEIVPGLPGTQLKASVGRLARPFHFEPSWGYDAAAEGLPTCARPGISLQYCKERKKVLDNHKV